MGYYEDHIEAVATRRAFCLKAGGEQLERRTLKKYGWNDEEIERIIKREKEISEKDGDKNAEIH